VAQTARDLNFHPELRTRTSRVKPCFDHPNAMAEKIDIEASKNEDFNKLKFSHLNKRSHMIEECGGWTRL
jgi:hypothetical protein